MYRIFTRSTRYIFQKHSENKIKYDPSLQEGKKDDELIDSSTDRFDKCASARVP